MNKGKTIFAHKILLIALCLFLPACVNKPTINYIPDVKKIEKKYQAQLGPVVVVLSKKLADYQLTKGARQGFTAMHNDNLENVLPEWFKENHIIEWRKALEMTLKTNHSFSETANNTVSVKAELKEVDSIFSWGIRTTKLRVEYSVIDPETGEMKFKHEILSEAEGDLTSFQNGVAMTFKPWRRREIIENQDAVVLSRVIQKSIATFVEIFRNESLAM